ENTINEEVRTNFITYLSKSADNGNHLAQYNLGKLFYFGKLNVPVDKEKGKKFLIIAAKNNNSEAIDLCREENIS
ncbi:20793_t:CDS:1, partial [Racocetra persica]